MEFQYVAYAEGKKIVKGKLSAENEGAATEVLSRGGFRVVSLKPVSRFFNVEGLNRLTETPIKPKEVVMFSRQLALLLASGTDVITSLELLQEQVTNKSLKKIIASVNADLHGGASLSTALSKHQAVFSKVYHRAVAAGEQSGNLEVVLRQMAEYIERASETVKKVKGALTYPVIVLIVAIGVVALMVTFVLPTFSQLYLSFGAKMPKITTLVMNSADWFSQYGMILLLLSIAAGVLGFLYIKTPAGKKRWDKILLLKLPVISRIVQLVELSRVCRTMALLFKVGLGLPDIMSQVSQGTNNTAMSDALAEVQRELIRGEGLSSPMSKRRAFLPLMVQMVKVGEETGKLDSALLTVAESYEVEADDRTTAAVGLLQPAITMVIAAVVGVIAMSMLSAMYSIYGQIAP